MKHPFIILILINVVNFGFCQDSLFITNHYSVYQEIQCCTYSTDYLKCLDSLILVNQQKRISSKNYQAEFNKQKKAILIYTINAGFIAQARGEAERSNSYFNTAEKYVDSLKLWGLYNKDIPEIMLYSHEIRKNMCVTIYRQDTALFYACDCAKFFPELDKEVLEEINIDATKHEEKLNSPVVNEPNLFGKFLLNDTLRFNSQFVCNSISSAYFEKNQALIFSKLTTDDFLEIFKEIGVGAAPDTLIIQIILRHESNKIYRECAVVYATCNNLVSEHYLYLFDTTEFIFTRDNVTFYIPIVIKQMESNIYFNLGKVTITNDHYLIEYEQLQSINLDSKR